MKNNESKSQTYQISTTEISRILKLENSIKLISNEITQYLSHLEGINKNFKVIIQTLNDFFAGSSIHYKTTQTVRQILEELNSKRQDQIETYNWF
jgi:cell shape-determining protein MreC